MDLPNPFFQVPMAKLITLPCNELWLQIEVLNGHVAHIVKLSCNLLKAFALFLSHTSLTLSRPGPGDSPTPCLGSWCCRLQKNQVPFSPGSGVTFSLFSLFYEL